MPLSVKDSAGITQTPKLLVDTVGDPSDATATTDTGTFSLIALFKRFISGGASAIPAKLSDITASGTITTQNLVPAGSATAGSAIAVATIDGSAALSIQVTGTYTGALSLQGTIDGTNWITVGGVVFYNVNTGAGSATITSAAVGIFQAECSGYAQMRVTGLAAMTGTATITIRASKCASLVALDSPVPAGSAIIGAVTQSGTWNVGITGYPTAAASADALTNPTVTQIGAAGLLFNGATWDRFRANINTTTGDTGAKTATGNGATQTNYNARGAMILFVVGTVSGTSPTCVFKLQGSGDGGTTWFDIPGAATASLTATGNVLLTVYPGVAAVANAAVSLALPRTWRVVWTLGGTSPSFTITSIQVASLN